METILRVNTGLERDYIYTLLEKVSRIKMVFIPSGINSNLYKSCFYSEVLFQDIYRWRSIIQWKFSKYNTYRKEL